MSDATVARETAQTGFFQNRLNYLWSTHLSARGTPYTLREVHEGTGRQLSLSYLSLLRRGGVATPSLEKLQLLADFFGVSVTYFTSEGTENAIDPTVDDELRQALRNPMVREIALRGHDLGREEWELVLHMIDYARQVNKRGTLNPSGRHESASVTAEQEPVQDG